MKRTLIAAAVIGLVGTLGAAPAQAENIGNEGCTPGYWKNHTDNWQEANASQTLTGKGFVTVLVPGSTTLLAALNFGGGPGLLGAEQILMRAAVTAWLNAAHEGLGYPLRRFVDGGILDMVNGAIASRDRATMLAVASYLDDLNNLGCPLN
jgi:hypothetical protein